MQAKRILVTGARAPVALELCRSFARAGHTVFIAESQWPNLCEVSDSVTQSFRLPPPRLEPLRFARALEQLVQSEKIDLVVPTCEEVFYVAHAAGLGGRPERYFVSGLSTLRQLHHKGEFVRLIQGLGLKAPQTWLLQHPDDLRRLPRQKLVFKPAFSRFAAKTRVWSPGQPMPELPVSGKAPWLAQAFVEGQELCSYGVARSGQLTAHAVYRPKWRAGFGASVYFEAVEHAEVLEFVRAVVGDLSFTGQIAFDFIQNAEGLWALECNPRATSGLHLLSPEQQIQAFLGKDLQTAAPSSRAKLGFAMGLFGLPTALRENRLGQWWDDWQSAREVVGSEDDPRPARHQWRCVLGNLHDAYRNKVGLLEATTLDLEWNGEELPTGETPLAKPELEASPVQVSPSAYIPNLQTTLHTLRQGDLALPLSIQSPTPGNSYIASSYTHYVSYATDELREIENPRLRFVLDGVLRGLGAWLRFCELDHTVYVNNRLLSTCLYPALEPRHIHGITELLTTQFPDKAVVWRSVHPYGGDRLKRALVAAGYALIPSRSVLFYNVPRGDHYRKKDFKNDLKLLEASGYALRKLEQPTGAELARVQELYTLLYIDKYSRFNPQYTVDFMGYAAESGLLEFYALEKGGQIDGVMGLYCLNGYMAAPVFGYDTALPQELGLYRLLSTHLTLEAERRGLILHASSGVAKFKRSRGATPELEWIAVYDRHLSLRRRLGWRALEFLMGEVAVPLIRKMGL
ncbi:MAG: GNAT family N-acetyltransferase [Meiothermus sp.]|nr:GNAT family N-acetyltransferase [Meiothermus sp.]